MSDLTIQLLKLINEVKTLSMEMSQIDKFNARWGK